MIYAIRCSGSGHIKFGKANNPKRRLYMLQTGNPSALHLIAAADWPDPEEYRIHEYLEKDWVLREWFRRSAEANKVIDCMRDENAGLEQWHKLYRPAVVRTPFIESRLARVLSIKGGVYG